MELWTVFKIANTVRIESQYKDITTEYQAGIYHISKVIYRIGGCLKKNLKINSSSCISQDIMDLEIKNLNKNLQKWVNKKHM